MPVDRWPVQEPVVGIQLISSCVNKKIVCSKNENNNSNVKIRNTNINIKNIDLFKAAGVDFFTCRAGGVEGVK